MLVALVAFVRLYCVTHQDAPKPEVQPTQEVVPIETLPGGGPGPSKPSPPLEPTN
jgi:hypothetical protein